MHKSTRQIAYDRQVSTNQSRINFTREKVGRKSGPLMGYFLIIIFAGILSSSYTQAAPIIPFTEITPSTSLIPSVSPGLGPWSIDQISDGITADIDPPLPGFVTSASSGTISLELDYEYDLESFLLWNDVRVQGQGIKDFSLEFFDLGGDLITTLSSSILNGAFIGPFIQLPAEEYFFDSPVSGVKKVDLVIANTHSLGIELREVALTGTLSSVPVPSAVWLFGSGLVTLLGFTRKFGSS